MPRKIIKYGCKYKCGHRAFHKIEWALAHEEICYKNPAMLTCETCTNRVYKDYSDDVKMFVRGCKLPITNDWMEDNDDLLRCGSGVHQKCLFNCPNWCSENESSETKAFLEMVRLKIKHQLDEEEKRKKENFDLRKKCNDIFDF